MQFPDLQQKSCRRKQEPETGRIGVRNGNYEYRESGSVLRDFQALKNINMEIDENQITAFIGPSGCGKSTFLKTLNRMNDLVEGLPDHRKGDAGGRGYLPGNGRKSSAETRRYGISETESFSYEYLR